MIPTASLSPLRYESLPRFLESASGWLTVALQAFLPRGEPEALLYDLIRDYPERGGKRFRPAVMLLSCALSGADPRRALPTALALELFHNFALVHDDIEDGSLLRRGRPTLHRLHGVSLALNVGDMLFALVYEALQANTTLLGAETTHRVQEEVQTVIRRTLEGQAWDIGWIANRYWPTRTEYTTMIRHKTGWYSGRGPCRIGGVIGGASEAVVAQLGDFGERLGIGFQVRDDLLNLASDSSQQVPGGGLCSGRATGTTGKSGEGYGKERGGDIAEGKRTLIVIEMMERLPVAKQKHFREILCRPPANTTADDIDWVIEQAATCGALAAVEAHCQDLGTQAHEALAGFPPSPQREVFREAVDYLVLNRRG